MNNDNHRKWVANFLLFLDCYEHTTTGEWSSVVGSKKAAMAVASLTVGNEDYKQKNEEKITR